MLRDDSLATLYVQLFPKMYQWLLSVGVKELHARDMVQDAFVKVWRRRAQISDETLPIGLLWTTLRNLRIDHFRRTRVVLSLDADDPDALLEPVEEEPHRLMDGDYVWERIQGAAARLSAEMRKTYHLFFIEELPIRLIAEHMGVSETLVKVRIHRARARLRAELDDLR